MDHETVVAYLDRVGVTAPAVGDAAGLRALHRAHQLTVPFENLSIHLAEPVSLDERDLIDKIVRRRRGGFCYELNGAFALLLEALGAQVSRVAARVYGEAAWARRSIIWRSSCARPTAAGHGSPTWVSAVTATIHCCWKPGMTRTIRPAGSGSPTLTQEISTS